MCWNSSSYVCFNVFKMQFITHLTSHLLTHATKWHGITSPPSHVFLPCLCMQIATHAPKTSQFLASLQPTACMSLFFTTQPSSWCI